MPPVHSLLATQQWGHAADLFHGATTAGASVGPGAALRRLVASAFGAAAVAPSHAMFLAPQLVAGGAEAASTFAGSTGAATAIAAASPSSVLTTAGLGSFARRLLSSLLRFFAARLRRFPLLLQMYERVRAWFQLYDSRPTGQAGVDGFIRLVRTVGGALRSCADFLVWVLNPWLLMRRVYRLAVGLVVLYLLHWLNGWAGSRLRALREWVAVERGLWRGEEHWVRKRELTLAMASAASYNEWKSAAEQLDKLEAERIVWKGYRPSKDFHWKRIARNVDSIRKLIAAHQAMQLQTAAAGGAAMPSPAASAVSSAPFSAPLSSSAATAAAAAATAATSTAALAAPSSASTSPSSGPQDPLCAPAASSPSDPQALMRFLRSRLIRNIGNITNANLYWNGDGESDWVSCFPRTASEAAQAFNPSTPLCLRVGTKALIEEYHAEVIRGLETVLQDGSIPPQAKLSFFRETRHAYGRSALLLNGGANLGLYHLGVVKALLEIDVLPQIISGSSVGAIFAALICSRTDAELQQIGSKDFLTLNFPSVRGSLRRKLKRFLSEGILMDIQSLIHCVRAHIGDITFLQAYQRYGRVCNIIVRPIHMGRKKKNSTAGGAAGGAATAADDDQDFEGEQQHSSEPILLNYLTAPTVLIWSAACASCAVPHLYRPVELLAKNPAGEIVPYFSGGGTPGEDEQVLFGAGCADGSVVKMDVGGQTHIARMQTVAMDRLRTLFNCNNFIVSQLNLSLLPFIFGGTSFRSASPLQKLLRYLAREIYQRVLNAATLFGLTSEGLGSSYSLVRAAWFLHNLASQRIKGDVTLVPPVSWRDYAGLLSNPTNERLHDCVDVGRRYTWTKGSLIKAHCVVEFALDRCVRVVRGEMAPGAAAPPPLATPAHAMAGPYSSTSMSASSGAFAHPSRLQYQTHQSHWQASPSHSLVGSGSGATSTNPNPTASPFATSPAMTPMTGGGPTPNNMAAVSANASFWSRKLNARALLPTRKASLTRESDAPLSMPAPVHHMVHSFNQHLPLLDLADASVGTGQRHSPPSSQRPMGGGGSGSYSGPPLPLQGINTASPHQSTAYVSGGGGGQFISPLHSHPHARVAPIYPGNNAAGPATPSAFATAAAALMSPMTAPRHSNGSGQNQPPHHARSASSAGVPMAPLVGAATVPPSPSPGAQLNVGAGGTEGLTRSAPHELTVAVPLAEMTPARPGSITVSTRSVSGSPVSPSSSVALHNGGGGDGGENSSSNSSTAPSSPLGQEDDAGLSRASLLSQDDGASSASVSASTSASGSLANGAALAAIVAAKSKAAPPMHVFTAPAANSSSMTQGVLQSPSPASRSPVMPGGSSGSSSLSGRAFASLLRTVPSLPGSSAPSTLVFGPGSLVPLGSSNGSSGAMGSVAGGTGSGSTSTSTLIPASVSGLRLQDDGFNSDVMKQLQPEMMMFTMPAVHKKHGRKGAKAAAAAAAATTPTAAADAAKQSSAASGSSEQKDGGAATASDSGSSSEPESTDSKGAAATLPPSIQAC